MDAAIAGEILTTVTGMAGATKAVAEAVKALKTKLKGNQEAERAASDALDQIFSLRTGMLDLQEKALSLQQELSRASQELSRTQNENIQLREEIRREKERTADLQQFQRKQVGRAIVMVRQSEPNVFYCATCFDARHTAIPLQGLSDDFEELGTHQCPECKSYCQTRKR